MPAKISSLLLTGFLILQSTPAFSEFDPGRGEFPIQFRGKTVNFERFFFNVLPGEEVTIRVPGRMPGPFTLLVDGTEIPAQGPARWSWKAPRTPAHLSMRIEHADGPGVDLTVFVKTPMVELTNGGANGYRLGAWPNEPLRGNPVYLPPTGLIEVTADMAGLQITPHFTLGQFLCKQQPDQWPKYMALREPLLIKLELILEEVNRRGIRTDTLAILSGFRTPWYNRNIGNGAYSRHNWGGAADIYIDTNGDGQMDDINGDGVVDLADAEYLHQIVEGLFGRRDHRHLAGGLGLYGPRPHRGPFVHVDARGHDARWAFP